MVRNSGATIGSQNLVCPVAKSLQAYRLFQNQGKSWIMEADDHTFYGIVMIFSWICLQLFAYIYIYIYICFYSFICYLFVYEFIYLLSFLCVCDYVICMEQIFWIHDTCTHCSSKSRKMIRSDKVWHFADVLHFAIYYINVLHLVLASGFASWVKHLERTRASLCFTGCHTARWETVRKRVQPTHSNSTMSSQSQYSIPMHLCVSFSKKQP